MSDDNTSTALMQLEAALRANGIQVPEGAVQLLLDQREWIYRSSRVDEMLEKLSKEQLYSVFNSHHHIDSASRLFNFIKGRRSCVVYGHKCQGKTQFLFFVFKLLQAMGEKVLFLDRTVLPSDFNNLVSINKDSFCGHLWRDTFCQLNGEVKDTLEQFFLDALPHSSENFSLHYNNIQKAQNHVNG